jgi:C-terminal processing protease CtpA/Prc
MIIGMDDYPQESVRRLLQTGDVILEINDKKPTNMKHAAQSIINETSTLTLEILRLPDDAILSN